MECTLPNESGSEHLAAGQVGEAVQRLNWPATHLERLKLALAQAIRNALERSRLGGSKALLHIRVLTPQGREATQAANQSGYGPTQLQVSEDVVEQANWSTARGWGFFLVQKQGDNPPAPAGESPYLIELFLYQGKKHSRKYNPNHLS